MSKYKNPEIHRAILRGDMARMLAAIDAGMLNARDAECQTPLHWASWRGAGGRYLEFMRALIDAGADIHATDGRGRTPMHLGASVGKSRGVRLLIEQGADVHATDVNEDTPLCTVLGEWYRYAIYALLDNGAEPGNCHDQLADLYLNMCNLDWRDELRLYSYRRSVLAALLRRGLDALYVFDAARGYHLLHALCRYGARCEISSSTGQTRPFRMVRAGLSSKFCTHDTASIRGAGRRRRPSSQDCCKIAAARHSPRRVNGSGVFHPHPCRAQGKGGQSLAWLAGLVTTVIR